MSAVDPNGGQKYWFNGLPYSGIGIIARPSGPLKYWFNGLPVASLIPAAAFVPPPGNKGGNGKDKGKGNDPSNSRFDPYGRYAAYHAWREEASHLHRRRLYAFAPFSQGTVVATGGMHAIESGSPNAYAINALHPIEDGISA